MPNGTTDRSGSAVPQQPQRCWAARHGNQLALGYAHKTVSSGLIPLKDLQIEVSLTAHLCAGLPSASFHGYASCSHFRPVLGYESLRSSADPSLRRRCPA